MPAARAEVLSLLDAFGPSLPQGGPLGEIGGLIWLDLARPTAEVERRLPLLGYACAAYELVRLSCPPPADRASRHTPGRLPASVRWRGSYYGVRLIWRRDEAEERDAAPDRRSFLLPGAEKQVREVRGYRGDRRGLPPADARLTVNLSLTPGCRTLLDPFAGAGGIVAAAMRHGLQVLSIDIDPFVRYGLQGMGAAHFMGDARRLPFAAGSIDAIATEPPFLPDMEPTVIEGLHEFARVVRPRGRICMFASRGQLSSLAAATAPTLTLLHRFPIDRKGTPCEALVWERA
jgi:hypothetical protein